MENKSKAETFVGFAIRAKKFRIGLNAVATLKKANLLIVCKTASENTVKDAGKLKRKFNCPMLITVEKTLEEITHRENAKVMAIADFALAKAILDNSEKDFIARD
ncbi:MAG: hypothetical protein IKJ14_03630 [Clostridia bacterium]|nr:hypothetical protein [Clostridia bacterium]MBR3804412.1 hypothetical protein [Clostridia bacterium]